jgi:hypothetical protein
MKTCNNFSIQPKKSQQGRCYKQFGAFLRYIHGIKINSINFKQS